MSTRLVTSSYQGYALQNRLSRLSWEQAAENGDFGPEEGVVEISAQDLMFVPTGERLTLKFCCISNAKLLKGSLPEVIQDITLDEELTWLGDLDSYVTAKLTLSLNGHTQIIKAEPRSRMKTVTIPISQRSEEDLAMRTIFRSLIK